MKKAKIIGAGGYGGAGIVELLLGHPEMDIVCLVDKEQSGLRFSDCYPHLSGFCDTKIHAVDAPQAQEAADVVFFSTPDGVGMRQAAHELKQGAKVIDYSGDFRFGNVEDYTDYATRLGRDQEHKAPELLQKTVYGLPELNLDDIAQYTLVGNPGCFAVSVLLGLAPAIKEGVVDFQSIICDCKTGVSGAGKTPKPLFHYPARYDHMNAYRLGGHQHVCEIEKQLKRLGGTEISITFTAQVVPATRGIMSCLYAKLEKTIPLKHLINTYREFYASRPFVRIYDRNASIGTVHVRGSNYCNLIVDIDERTGTLRVISHIDNLMKGQSGSALQNMNLLLGFPETMGLDHPGNYP